jgi:hypothetical protein
MNNIPTRRMNSKQHKMRMTFSYNMTSHFKIMREIQSQWHGIPQQLMAQHSTNFGL